MSDEISGPSESENESESQHLAGEMAPPVPPQEVPTAAIALPPVPTPTQAPVPAEEYGAAEPPPAPTLPETAGTPIVPLETVLGGSYALGALSGNPHLGPAAGAGAAGPPTGTAPPVWGAPPDPAAPRSRPHRMRNLVAVAGAVVIALAAGAGIGHAAWKNSNGSTSALGSSNANSTHPHTGSSGNSGGSFGSPFGNSGDSGSSGNTGNTGASSGPSDVSAIADKVDPGLVDIDTTLGYQSEEAAGTGIVLTSNGEILTNNHVIDGATSISVTDVGNGHTYSASVVGYDRTSDIAVLQLHNASGLQTASIGNSSKVAVGEDVVGIGNAGGTGGTPSAAGGSVTALDQSITASDEGDGSSEQLTGLIETNADIQPGDSGGSLVNTSGQVLGIDTAASAGFSFQSSGQSGTQGYAIPINAALSLAQKIVDGDATSTIHIGATAFLGVKIEPSSSSGSGFGGTGNSGSGETSGVSIAQVVTSSPAQEAGLAEGDVITAVNGQTITSPTKLTNLLEPDHPGDSISLTWTDNSGASHTATIQLSSGPPQ
jgi:S1-C subfamily serine protease